MPPAITVYALPPLPLPLSPGKARSVSPTATLPRLADWAGTDSASLGRPCRQQARTGVRWGVVPDLGLRQCSRPLTGRISQLSLPAALRGPSTCSATMALS